jgi:methylase of polypeptide subunit release factors
MRSSSGSIVNWILIVIVMMIMLLQQQQQQQQKFDLLSALEIGFGTGTILRMMAGQCLRKHGLPDSHIHVTVIDMSSEMVQIAKQTCYCNNMDHIITKILGHLC